MSRDVTMWPFTASCSRLRSCFLLSWYISRTAEQEEHFRVKQREKYLRFHPNAPTLELTEAPQRSWLRLNSCFGTHSSRSTKCLTPNLTKKRRLRARRVLRESSNPGGRIKCHQAASLRPFNIWKSNTVIKSKLQAGAFGFWSAN